MNMREIGRQPWISWLTVGLLAASCCVLALLQYRWITEFSAAERDRLHGELQGRLNLLSMSFNEEVSNAASGLVPTSYQFEELGPEAAYAARYETWRQSHGPWFRRIALVAAKG